MEKEMRGRNREERKNKRQMKRKIGLEGYAE